MKANIEVISRKILKEYESLKKSKKYVDEVKYYADEIISNLDGILAEEVIVNALRGNVKPLSYLIRHLQDTPLKDILFLSIRGEI